MKKFLASIAAALILALIFTALIMSFAPSDAPFNWTIFVIAWIIVFIASYMSKDDD